MTYLGMAKRLKLHRMMRIILLRNQYRKEAPTAIGAIK